MMIMPLLKSRHLSHYVVFAISLILCGGLLMTLPVHAQSRDDNEHMLSEATYNALTEINKLLENENYNVALDKLRQLAQDIEADNHYEQAVVDQTYGYAYNGLQRYDQAAESFIKAVESDALPTDVSHRLEYYIAQLLAQNNQYSKAITYLERWLADETDPGVDAHRLAAGLYYEVKNYQAAIEQAQAAIQKSQKANESLYQLLLAAYFETKNYSQTAVLLEKMLQLFPDNDNYWKQLASTYQLLNQERKALAVTELAYRQDLLNSEEKLNLARLYLSLQAPYRAAKLLHKEIDNGNIKRTSDNLKLLADSYYLAHETDAAITAYGEAASLSGDANLFLRQGQLLVQEQRWQEARAPLQRAISGANLDNRSMANLLLGMTAYHLEDDKLATEALRRASQSQDTSKQAEYWLQQIEQRS